MTCFSPEHLATYTETAAGTITNANTVVILAARAGRKVWINFASLTQSVTGTTTCQLYSDGSPILICGSDDEGSSSGLLVEDNDVSVVTTGTGTSFYTVTYSFI